MKSTYTKKDILDISEVSNTLIYEHLNYQDINNIYFLIIIPLIQIIK